MAEKSIGALWEKKGKSGDYFTGNIEIGNEKIAIVAFYNSNKKNPKEPDYRILKSIPKEPSLNVHEQTGENSNGAFPEEEISPDEIPF